MAFVLTWMAMMALTFLTCTGFLSLISWHSNMSPPNPRHGATTGPTAVFIHAFLQPWSSVPAGSYTVLPVGPYSSGWVAYNDYLPPRAHSQFLVTYWLQFDAMLLSPWLIAIAFAALPIARRRAKVRWRHLGRAAAYSYAIVVPLIMLFTLQRAATHNAFYRGTAGAPIVKWFVALIGRLLSIPLPLALSIAMIMLTGYWWLCIRLHLQMQRSWAVAIVVVTIGMLAAASIAFLER